MTEALCSCTNKYSETSEHLFMVYVGTDAFDVCDKRVI